MYTNSTPLGACVALEVLTDHLQRACILRGIEEKNHHIEMKHGVGHMGYYFWNSEEPTGMKVEWEHHGNMKGTRVEGEKSLRFRCIARHKAYLQW